MKIGIFVAISCILHITGAMPVFDVSVEYFSGKTNPKWKLDQSSPNYTEISNLYTVAEKSKQLFTLENMPSVLGYRGFVLSDGKDTYVLVVGQKTVQLQKLLLESAPKGLLSSKLLSTLTTAIEKGIEPILTRRERRSTNYPPGNTWKDVKVLKCNNCYNYGTDRLSAFHRDRGLPGLGGGLVYTDPITPVNLRNSAVLDRLIVTPAVGGNIPVIPQHQQAARHLVALVVAQESFPGADDDDFHWYRLDSNNNGRWSHKPGASPVTIRDGNNNYILDPRIAVNDPLGPNYVFDNFMTVPKNVVTVQGEVENSC
ncbi:uncharacterized protein LOC110241653 [Exaiptasia diaphana]|uniref:Uncharacterized protein n=1 Tax=Exaiptasia diaphana TaxID=2652724 RepID=A0A913XF41_EXADI|nr:uncharacterized protein LOC110241653 [Exaiptasia diaphana]